MLRDWWNRLTAPVDEPEPGPVEVTAQLTDLFTPAELRVLVDGWGVLPDPAQTAAGLVDDRLVTSDLPDLAARWLAAGIGGDAVAILAGHPVKADAVGIDRLWSDVHDELGLVVPDENRAELLWVPVLLARWRTGELTSDGLARALPGSALRWGDVPGLSDVMLLTDHYQDAVGARRGALTEERERLLVDWARDVRLHHREPDDDHGRAPGSSCHDGVGTPGRTETVSSSRPGTCEAGLCEEPG